MKAVLKNPDYDEKTFDNKYKAGKLFEGKTLEVIYTKTKNIIIIITAYYI